MLSPSLLALFGTLIQLSTSSSTSSNSSCRAAPFTSDWPSAQTWSTLNTTLSGQLLTPYLAASVCYSSRPEFDPSACRDVFQQWQTQEFHVEDPISVQINQWTDWSCLPKDLDAQGLEKMAKMPILRRGGNKTKVEGAKEERECSGRGYPAYVVNATTAAHVQAAVNFAREHNVRLSVKNTGHDVPGRSNAPGALSIWTHNLNSMEYQPGSFKLTGSGKTIKGDFIKAGSGCQAYNIQTMANKHGRVFTSGGSKNVGLGGFVTGGGHSALSPHFGLGADNVMEMEVVTPDGKVSVVNEDMNPDIFWALRGGGGSTFGVVTSLVLRLHKDKPLQGVLLYGIAEPDSETARELVPWALSKIPYLMDSGISGYMFGAHGLEASPVPNTNTSAYGEHPPAGGFTLTGLYWDPEEDDAVEKVVQPLLDEAKERWGNKTQLILYTHRYESFLDWFDETNDDSPVGYSEYIVSRLFDKETLEDEKALREIIEPAMEPVWGIAAFMVAGKGVRDADIPGGSNAAHPAWRRSSALGITWMPYPDYDKEAGQKTARELDEAWQPIRDQMPDSGAYVNEGFKEEKEWEDTFWGDNYERLFALKRKIDPTDVFWCKPCVGYDRWREVETAQGRQLCRAE